MELDIEECGKIKILRDLKSHKVIGLFVDGSLAYGKSNAEDKQIKRFVKDNNAEEVEFSDWDFLQICFKEVP